MLVLVFMIQTRVVSAHRSQKGRLECGAELSALDDAGSTMARLGDGSERNATRIDCGVKADPAGIRAARAEMRHQSSSRCSVVALLRIEGQASSIARRTASTRYSKGRHQSCATLMIADQASRRRHSQRSPSSMGGSVVWCFNTPPICGSVMGVVQRRGHCDMDTDSKAGRGS